MSRDIIRITGERFGVQHYIARQSWVSAFSPPTPKPEKTGLTSRFEHTSLIGDFLSDAPMRLKQHAASSDLILFDLATDRRGVVPIIGTGGYVSYTGELGRSRLLQQVPHSARIEFQSDKHFALFQRAATKLKDLLVSLDTFDRATVLHFPMTDTAVDGAEVPKLRGVTADQWNDTYRRYYGLLVELGFNMLSLPADLALTTSQHKWGPEQNHFIDDAYLWWADRLEEFIRPTTARSL